MIIFLQEYVKLYADLVQVRQKGGIGSAAYDPNQKDIRAFFKGAGSSKAKQR